MLFRSVRRDDRRGARVAHADHEGVADRLAALRAAFDAAVKDPALLAEAKQQHLEMGPLPGSEVQALIERLYASPEPLVKRARVLLGTEK